MLKRSPNATYPLKDELAECRKFTGLDLPLTRPGERVRDRRSEPPHDRLNRLISAAHAERDRSFEVRAELGMNRINPTEAVTDPRRDSLSSPLHLITQPAVSTAQPPAADNSRSRASSSVVALREAIASPW